MKLQQITIEKFRHINGLSINVGDRLTAIAGGNGTGKSSILGLIAGIFDFNHRMPGLEKIKFAAKFSEIFTFSPAKEAESVGGYKYKTKFSDGTVKSARFRYLGVNSRPFRIDIGERGKSGDGKIRMPVIYLGLRRLFPISQEDSLKISYLRGGITDDEKNWIGLLYEKIMATRIDIKFEKYISSNKNFISLINKNHDSYGNSAGQDNLSQILTSFLLFKRLKKANKNYQGGIFLIDELDVTLYPGAQITLMHVMQDLAKEFNVQVIFTTHSTEIIHTLNLQNFKDNSKCIFLKKNEKNIVYCIEDGNKIENILFDIKNQVAPKMASLNKIDLYSEDDEARYIITSILDSDNKKRLNIVKKSFSADGYKKMMEDFSEIFDKKIVVLDGDKETEYPRRAVYILGQKRPENLILDFLKELSEDDDFWGGIGEYNKQTFLSNQPIANDRKTMKQWFNNERKFWNKKKLFIEFNRKYLSDCSVFNEKIKKLIKEIEKK